MEHYSVLLNECIEMLQVKEDGIYIDATLGRAGHSKEILKRLNAGQLIAFDLDQEAIKKSVEILSTISSNFTLVNDNYANMKKRVNEYGIEHVDGILMDLGVSSPQFDNPERGFSYRYDGPLDMRMNQQQALTAYEVVNNWSYEDLVRILFRYGEESFAKQIARKIEARRQINPIETTLELVEVIKSALPDKVKNKKGHPAKKSFQAIRIAVNQELEMLEKAIVDALELLSVGGRLAVITFHSLEDRIVKTIFKEYSTVEKYSKRLPIKAQDLPEASYVLVNKKAILPSTDELDINRRSHSAKLRVIERRAYEKDS